MCGGVVMGFRVFAILRHGLDISARKVEPFGLVTIIVISSKYSFFWYGAAGWLAELLISKFADFKFWRSKTC